MSADLVCMSERETLYVEHPTSADLVCMSERETLCRASHVSRSKDLRIQCHKEAMATNVIIITMSSQLNCI